MPTYILVEATSKMYDRNWNLCQKQDDTKFKCVLYLPRDISRNYYPTYFEIVLCWRGGGGGISYEEINVERTIQIIIEPTDDSDSSDSEDSLDRHYAREKIKLWSKYRLISQSQDGVHKFVVSD